jgi:pimeloyl-ACP methyl ester carboxylesterase
MSAVFPSYLSNTVLLDGIGVHYLIGGSGTPLVLVHGLGSSAGVEFYYNLEALAGKHQVFGVDLPGFGKSDKPSLDYDMPFFIKTVADFLASQGLERVALMGVSMGGRIALGVALERPEVVSKLVLVDALGIGRPKARLAYQMLLMRGLGELTLTGTAHALRRMDPRLIRRLWAWYLRRPGSMDGVLTDQRIADHGALLATPGYRAAYLGSLRSIAGMGRLKAGMLVSDSLQKLRMPTLLVWGRHDHIFPARDAEAASAKIPSARLVVFEGSGHTPQMEEPDRFNQLVLEFLES